MDSSLNKALDRALAEGADAAEVYVVRSRRLSIRIYQQKVESLTSSDSEGMGVRVWLGDRIGYRYHTDLSAAGECAAAAREQAQYATPDPSNVVPQSQVPVADLALFRPELPAASVEEKIELLKQIEESTKIDTRTRPRDHHYSEQTADVFVANSKGIQATYRLGYALISSWVIAEEEGDVQSGWNITAGRSLGDLDRAVGRKAAQKALALLGAQKIASGKAAVLLDPMVACQFLAVVGGGLSAEAVQKGRSPFGHLTGEPIAASNITLVDDGRLLEGLASAPIDDEGVPTQRTVLVEDGILKSFLHNSRTAAKAGSVSTGNASRASFRSLPGVSSSNLLILPGELSQEQLIQRVDSGLLVTDVSGVHSGANPVSGEISLGAKGLWIEGGRIVRPVREVAIAGHLREMLQGIEAVGSDFLLSPVAGSTGSPTLLLKEMTLSGA